MSGVRAVDVLIAGGGPCGLMLAIELGRRGVGVLLVDPKPGTAVNPQANATQAITMEHYRRLGFADEVRALGLPPDYPTDIAYFTRYAGHELARFQLPSASKARSLAPTLSGSWSAAELPHRVSQKFVEAVLRRHAEALPSVTLDYGRRLGDFTDLGEGVEARIEAAAGGACETVAARWLVGADGPRSTVRRALGIGYAGETGVARDFFGGKMVALYLRAPDFHRASGKPPAWMYWCFNRERRSFMAAVDGVRDYAFHTQLKPGEEGDVDDARARVLFAQAMGAPLDIEVLAIDTWTAGHALVAQSFGRGRVVIAGDAAHLFTPAGGLGYNTAVEDAVNLGWKLAADLSGTAGPALVDSYRIERKMLAERNTGYARGFARSIGDYAPDARIEDASPEGEAARREAGAYLEAHARAEFNIPGVTFGGRYDGSPVIVGDGSEPPPDRANHYEATACPGGRPPHLWLAGGRSLFDSFGRDWTLLRTADAADPGFADAARARGVHLDVVSPQAPGLRDLYAADFALIRPDRIVAWRGGDAEADTILAQALGHAA